MNYVDSSQLRGFGCVRCRNVFDDEFLSPDHANVCEECGLKLDIEIAAERALEFRGLSHDWFTGVGHLTLAQCVDRRDAAVRAA